MQRAFSLVVLLITAPTLYANVTPGNLGRLLEEDGLPMPHDWARQVCMYTTHYVWLMYGKASNKTN
jgi:hypothetical protein